MVPFFNYLEGGDKVSGSFFRDKLRSILHFLGISGRKVTGHSFRAGGASFLKILGFSDKFIKLKGLWTSTTYKEYINTGVNFSLQKKRLVIKGKTKFKQMLDKLEEEQGSPERPVSSKGELQSVGSLGKDPQTHHIRESRKRVERSPPSVHRKGSQS